MYTNRQLNNNNLPLTPYEQHMNSKYGLWAKYAMVLKTRDWGSGGTGGETDTYFLTSRSTIISTYVTGNTYYLDANNGSDTIGDGSSGSPYKTLTKALTMPAGSLILLRNGNYGAFSESRSSSRANWLVFMNDVGHSPTITSITCSSSSSYTYKLIFYGIQIAPAAVDPGATDSMYASSTQSTYNKTANPLTATYVDYVRFYNCEFVGTNKYLTVSTAYLSHTNYIYFERCHMHRIWEGVTFIYTTNLTIYYCNIHNLAACPIKDGGVGSSYITFEGNHAHDCGYSLTDPYCPKASGENPHGSLTVNSPNYTIRNNFCHNLGASRGIYFYPDGSPTYSNMLIENNVFYDPHNSICVQLELIGSNVIVRNNTFIGARKNYPADTDDYQYNVAFYFSDYKTGYSSGLKIYNNIFVGIASVSGLTVTSDKNICYVASGLAGTNISAYPSYSYFESGFFNNGSSLNLHYPLDTYDSGDAIINLTLKDGSPAIGYGDSNNQPSDSLGTLDSNNEYLIPNGIARDATHHDAGAYQR